ncbi:hypothetical protein Aduo_006417 [Ancylostoma duodenale]
MLHDDVCDCVGLAMNRRALRLVQLYALGLILSSLLPFLESNLCRRINPNSSALGTHMQASVLTFYSDEDSEDLINLEGELSK